MTAQSLEGRLRDLLAAKTPVLLVVSDDEERVDEAIRTSLATLPAGIEAWSWTVTEGLRTSQTIIQGTAGVADALNAATRLDRSAVFFFKDLHLLLDKHDPWLIRRLKDLAASFRVQGKALVFRSPSIVLPDDLVPTVVVVEDAPPTRTELMALLREWKGSAKQDQGPPAPDLAEGFLRAAAGLRLYEVRRILNRAQPQSPGAEDWLLAGLVEEKARFVNRSGLLEYVPSDLTLERVGGLQNFKGWLQQENTSSLRRLSEWG